MSGRTRISSGSPWESRIGYSRAVVAGDWIFVSGTTGFDYATMTIAGDVVAQAEQCLKNIGAALREAGSGFDDVVRVTYILPDSADFEPCWPVFRKYFGQARPAADHLDLVGRERRGRLGSRGKPLELHVELLLGEVALLHADEDGEIAGGIGNGDIDAVGGKRARRRE